VRTLNRRGPDIAGLCAHFFTCSSCRQLQVPGRCYLLTFSTTTTGSKYSSVGNNFTKI